MPSQIDLTRTERQASGFSPRLERSGRHGLLLLRRRSPMMFAVNTATKTLQPVHGKRGGVEPIADRFLPPAAEWSRP